MRILFKYATRSRSIWFQKTITQYKRKLSGKHSYTFVISCNTNDRKMNNRRMIKFMKSYQLEFYFGPHKNKIEAINADMEGRDFDILVVISDDMIPKVRGFDDIIVQDMQKYFPNLDGALHYNDLSHCGAKVISLSIIGKKLYDRFGYIYWPEYISLWCDNEFTDIVRRLNKVQWLDKCVIKHDWKGNKGTCDSLYKKNNSFYDFDQVIYDRRKEQGFPGALVDEKLQKTLKF